MAAVMTQEIYISALDWLGWGFSLLPVYSRSKYIVEGFTFKNSICDQAAAARYFLDSDRYNLAVVCPPGYFVLDFDVWEKYCRWLRMVKKFDDALARSYTELTPGGGAHVFLSGELPDCYVCRPGVEIKRHCLVAPSVLAGFCDPYEVLSDFPIYHGTMDAALYYVLKPCFGSALEPVVKRDIGFSSDDGWISKIKVSLSIVGLFKKYYPNAQLKQRGRYYNSCCPFHAEKNPSFYIDTQLNIFGCHACKARGDVINFYALIRNISNEKAVRDLMTYVC